MTIRMKELLFSFWLAIQISPAFTTHCSTTYDSSTLPPDCDDEEYSWTGAVVGGVIGGILFVVVVVVIVICIIKHNNRSHRTVLAKNTKIGGSTQQQSTSVSMVGGYNQQPMVSGYIHQSGYTSAYGGYSHTTTFPPPGQGAPTTTYGGYPPVPPPAQYHPDPSYPQAQYHPDPSYPQAQYHPDSSYPPAQYPPDPAYPPKM